MARPKREDSADIVDTSALVAAAKAEAYRDALVIMHQVSQTCAQSDTLIMDTEAIIKRRIADLEGGGNG
jgi:hypothetical protein